MNGEGFVLAGESKYLKKTVPVPFSPPQMAHGLAWD
jgi:hypothetical protein